jgi:hypothetical protein
MRIDLSADWAAFCGGQYYVIFHALLSFSFVSGALERAFTSHCMRQSMLFNFLRTCIHTYAYIHTQNVRTLNYEYSWFRINILYLQRQLRQQQQ